MPADHSPEPWYLRHPDDDGDWRPIADADDEAVLRVTRDDRIVGGNADDLRRIVAAVNACKGIPTADLEAMSANGGLGLFPGYTQWLGYHMKVNG